VVTGDPTGLFDSLLHFQRWRGEATCWGDVHFKKKPSL